MDIFKALFSGIANFFKILFGGILGAFSGSEVDVLAKDVSQEDVPAATSEPKPRGDLAAPVSTSAPTPAAATEPSVNEPTVAEPAAAVAVTEKGPVDIKEIPMPKGDVQFASLNELKAIASPKRRPGAALNPFKSMVRDMQKTSG
ncbi:MAG: hypothetical protein AB4040_16840 [Synechococcus sp.]